MIRLLSAGLVLLATSAHADGAFSLCDIFNGQASGGCGSWYQGKAVVKKEDGRYYEWWPSTAQETSVRRTVALH